ncbi:metallophosphoesterase [Ancylomarina sp. 16SWW S1-10-2]|uniref:metallophosphoesterase family protein n=1 Tax=Ancylomarina sp. 16SWW S1-10-2 TaxID=2499681 RepID=UPI0012AD5131|nr:metallophosphoesterase [Ancylomarina sp. 16SWW S1-10-2]MRT94399.1 metallophosphoesterase [Ancylomarina sp. 16SWW S1-10-2]
MRRRDFLKQTGILSAVTLTGLLSACNVSFEYSPYDVVVEKKYQDLTAKNLAKLKELEDGKTSFKIAFISDSHNSYDDFEDQIEDINSRDDIDFVIHGGDLTLSALSKEFTWFNEIISKLKVPFLTVIGNHDYLSSGESIYQKSFGPTSYVFTFRGCKFVMFDNIIWENGNNDPDFDWFEENLINDGDYNHVIPVSHIPPWGDQMNYGNELAFNNIMEDKDIKLSIHGHTHTYYYGKKYGQIDYLIVGDTPDRNYAVISIDEANYDIERIDF